MARPLRIQYPGAVHHVMARGSARGLIDLDDADRSMFLNVLGRVVSDLNWLCHACCLMTTHDHLLIETTRRKSVGRHAPAERCLHPTLPQEQGSSGHVFQGRFKSAGEQEESFWKDLWGQCILGGEKLLQRVMPKLREKVKTDEIPRQQSYADRPLQSELLPASFPSKAARNQAIVQAQQGLWLFPDGHRRRDRAT